MTTITLDTDTLTRLSTDKLTFSKTPVTGTAVPAERNTPWTGRMLITGLGMGALGVTQEHRDRYLNTIQEVRSCETSNPQALLQVGEERFEYVRPTGAVLNPEFIDGRHYIILDRDGVELWTVRYNDEDHRGDRNRPHCPLSVVAGRNGEQHYYENDALSTDWTIPAYFEVEYETAGRSAVTDPAAEEEPVTEPEPIRENVSAAEDGPCWGLAEENGQGHATVNPEPAEGGMYLLWADDAPHRHLAMRLGGSWSRVGYYEKSAWSNGSVTFTPSSNPISFDGMRWVAARLVPVVSEQPEEGRPAKLSVEWAEAERAWSDLGEALVAMAEDKSWCPEYEEFATPLGLPERNLNRDWDVVGTADVSFTVDSPSSYIDERVASSLDLSGLSISTMTITGTVNFSIFVEDESEDGARSYVDRSEIEEWLGNNSSATDIEVTDYTIRSVDEA